MSAAPKKAVVPLELSKKLGVDLETRLNNLRMGVPPYDVSSQPLWPTLDGRPTPADLLRCDSAKEFRKQSTVVLVDVSGAVSFIEIRKELEEYGEILGVDAKSVESGRRTVVVQYYNPKMAHALVNATRDPHTLRANGVIPKYCQGHEDQRWSTQLSTTDIRSTAHMHDDMCIAHTSGEILQVCNFGLYSMIHGVLYEGVSSGSMVNQGTKGKGPWAGNEDHDGRSWPNENVFPNVG